MLKIRPGQEAAVHRHTVRQRCIILGWAFLLTGVGVIADPTHATAHAASRPTTQFQCEKKYKLASNRTRCFNQLPGANCAHPLIAEKAEETTRGAHRYFKITFQGEQDGEGGLATYTYAPVKNVGICPHGVVYKLSMTGREHCERKPTGEEYCSTEYGIKTISEPTTRTGGEFRAEVPPHMFGYLVVKGYFIHPPWTHHVT